MTNRSLQLQAIEMCKRDPVFFFRNWGWTYDPRPAIKDLPFIPYPFQDEYIEGIDKDIATGESSVTEKSRDMGVTWIVLTEFTRRFLLFDESFLLGSQKESKVDTLGDMDTLFERCRYIIKNLPDWFVGLCGYNRKDSGFLKIFKENGASLVGESMNDDFSRQGRYKAILLDEFAFVQRAEKVWRACGDSAPCKLAVSTPNGRHNHFSHLRHSGKLKVYTHHWRKHPNKDQAWYDKATANRPEKDVAQELDINYSISAGEAFYQGFSRGIHLRKMNISKDRQLILGWDYGFRHPNCSINQITAEGRWIIVDNIFGENQTTKEFGEYVRTYLNTYYAGFVFKNPGYGDPAGEHPSENSRQSSVEVLKSLGFYITSMPSNLATTNYAARKNIIEGKLNTIIDGIPALIVNDVLNNQIIVEGFEGGYHYPDANKYGGVKEAPVEDGYFEHPFNSIEYVGCALFRPVEYQKRESQPKKRRMAVVDNI